MTPEQDEWICDALSSINKTLEKLHSLLNDRLPNPDHIEVGTAHLVSIDDALTKIRNQLPQSPDATSLKHTNKPWEFPIYQYPPLSNTPIQDSYNKGWNDCLQAAERGLPDTR